MGESAALKERENMNCRIAEGMVNKYIDHTLPLNDLEDFLEHIEKCSSCYDELATSVLVKRIFTIRICYLIRSKYLFAFPIILPRLTAALFCMRQHPDIPAG